MAVVLGERRARTGTRVQVGGGAPVEQAAQAQDLAVRGNAVDADVHLPAEPDLDGLLRR